jgi:hypothetical protein
MLKSAMPQQPQIPPVEEIVKRGKAIYHDKYEKDLEARFPGQFVAVDITTMEATVAGSAEEALRLAREKDPQGHFHLIRIGHPAAFEAGWHMSSAR